jgi:hypothetical protein
MAPGPIAALLCALPPNVLTMLPAVFRFPPLVRARFTFIPLVVVVVLAIIIAVDLVLFVIIIAWAGVDGSGAACHRAGQGYQ